ncbi:MAG: hypothetical protein ACFFAS_14285 [Promethearchaeota archaeon]
MFKSKISRYLIIGFIILIVGVSFICASTNNYSSNDNNIYEPRVSADVGGMNDVIFTNISRKAELGKYGIVNIEDYLEFQNNHHDPITCIFVGLSPNFSRNLIYHNAISGDNSGSLLIERASFKSNGYEMIAIYLDSPLNPGQKTSVIYSQSYKDLIAYNEYYSDQQTVFSGSVFPIIPYKAEGSIISRYYSSSPPYSDGFGVDDSETNITTFDFKNYVPASGPKPSYLEAFSENLDEQQNFTVGTLETRYSKLEIGDLNREILISPWGIIKVTENFEIQNNGLITIKYIPMRIPTSAFSVSLTDYLGEISGTTIEDGEIGITFTYSSNRPAITPGSKMKVTLSYYLPFHEHSSVNWFQESVKLDLLTTTFDYLVKDQTIKVRIEGCQSVDYYSVNPDSIQKSQGDIISTYYSDYVSPMETKTVLFTYTISILDLSIRPIVFMLFIIVLSSTFVILSKRIKKKDRESYVLGQEILPIRDIREYCSLCEEKNALILEIRMLDENLRRKKIAKKKYNSVVENSLKKIEEIEAEITPFKNTLKEIGPIFENIIRKIDILDAERVSINDSINLLDVRYKQGKLPSRAAYQKLADGFLKRRRKIDRNYDKLIQQLRSYIL